MQKVAHCQPLKFIFFAILLWQDTFCQVLHKRTSPIFIGENSVTLFPVCNQMAGLTLGLDQVYILTNAWPIKTCSLKSTVKADLTAKPVGSAMQFLQFSVGLFLPHTS